jgi:hypothetical protein
MRRGRRERPQLPSPGARPGAVVMAVNVALAVWFSTTSRPRSSVCFGSRGSAVLARPRPTTPADVRCVSWFAKPALRSELRAPTRAGNGAGGSSVHGSAGNEAAGLGEGYRVHGLTRTTATVFTVAILGVIAILRSPMGPWITPVDLGGVLLSIAALTVLSVWACPP